MATINSFVVDVQGFKSMSNEFIMKEICIASVQSDYIDNFTVRSPTCYQRLSPQLQKRVDYIYYNIHGLHWDWGYTDPRVVVAQLKDTLKNADKVYIKGSERVKFLDFLLGRTVPVFDLDIFDYKGESSLDKNKYPSCRHSPTLHSELGRCALKKAYMYRDFVRKCVEKENGFSNFSN